MKNILFPKVGVYVTRGSWLQINWCQQLAIPSPYLKRKQRYMIFQPLKCIKPTILYDTCAPTNIGLWRWGEKWPHQMYADGERQRNIYIQIHYKQLLIGLSKICCVPSLVQVALYSGCQANILIAWLKYKDFTIKTIKNGMYQQRGIALNDPSIAFI